MDIATLLKQGHDIWGDEKLTLSGIIVRLGVVFGDLCRWERNVDKDTHTDEEVKKELGNLIFSTIRWCDDLGYDPEACIRIAMASQKDFAKENQRR